MKNKYTIKFILVICYFLSTWGVRSQQVNTMYFMDNVPVRNYLNPAFQPLGDFYFGLPVLGYSQFSVGSNSITLKDVLYKQNGETILFKNPNADYNKFYNILKSTLLFNTDFKVNLVDFGFRSGFSFWSFSLTERAEGNVSVPRDIMKLMIYGTPNIEYNSFDFKNLGFDMSVYTEAGVGYSRKLNDKWSIGGKLKFNYGTANASSHLQYFDLNASVEEWSFKGNGTLNIASPLQVQVGNDLKSINYTAPSTKGTWIKPIGLGAGVDLGFTFKPLNNLTFSAALLDLGYIHWNKNINNITFSADTTFNQFGAFNINSDVKFQSTADTILIALNNSVSTSQTSKPYTTYTSPKLNLGIEYGFFDNKLSLGLLSRTTKYARSYDQEFTTSINGRPVDWFNMSASYSILNGKARSIGAGIGLRTGCVHWLVSADYLPFNYASLPLKELNSGFPSMNLPVAYTTQGFNFALGVNLVLGNRKDADKDGVVDRKDKCPDTPFGVKVDTNGCPLDADGDGVPNDLDKCADTPSSAYNSIDSTGCPMDTDADSVPDYLDKCPETPEAAIGHVDIKGCELDADADSIPDYLDNCPDTPAGAKVDSTGCPVDLDGDGIMDNLNPDVPKEAFGTLDKNGNPLDTDGDGTPDYLDKTTTQRGIQQKVDLKKDVKSLFQKALQGIRFETGNAIILQRSHNILNQIAGVLIANPNYLIEVRGFADNVGNSKSNKILSLKRAIAVKKFLIKNKVEADRITTNGYGATLPVATNKTTAGRNSNRRVEFIVSYVEITLH